MRVSFNNAYDIGSQHVRGCDGGRRRFNATRRRLHRRGQARRTPADRNHPMINHSAGDLAGCGRAITCGQCRAAFDSDHSARIYAYPLYFFDYETYAPAIPAFDGFSPYQRIPFQFSLHVLPGPGATLEHFEFLQEECSDPTRRVAELLGEYIRPQGSVVVWYAPFER